MISKVKRNGRSVSQFVYNEIKKSIINFEFKPGMNFEENKLSQRFKVSRTPIRTALSKLEREGLVSGAFYKGFTVQQLSIQEFYEICVVREMLEGYATEIAATKLKNEDLIELERIQKNFEDLQENLLNPDLLAIHNELDAQLHGLILRCCGNGTIQRIIQNLSDKIQQIRFTASLERVKESIFEHLRIIEKLKAQDPNVAKKAMVDHLLALKEKFHKQW